jgi:NADH dehydrogenase
MKEIIEIILATIERKRTLLPVPFGIAKLQSYLLQFAPGDLKLTPDQVAMLRVDNVVSDAAKSAGLTLEGLGITPDSMEAVIPQYLWRFRATGQFAHNGAN